MPSTARSRTREKLIFGGVKKKRSLSRAQASAPETVNAIDQIGDAAQVGVPKPFTRVYRRLKVSARPVAQPSFWFSTTPKGSPSRNAARGRPNVHVR